MMKDAPTFEEIVQSLGSLSDAELASLEQITWDLKLKSYSRPEWKGSVYSVKAIFSAEPTVTDFLSFEAIKQTIHRLNPAEIETLHTLLTWHLDKSHDHDGDHVSSSWGSDNVGVLRGDFGISSEVLFLNNSFRPDADTTVKNMMQRFIDALHAKDDGDSERAKQLSTEILRMAEQAGVPDYMLKHLAELLGDSKP